MKFINYVLIIQYYTESFMKSVILNGQFFD